MVDPSTTENFASPIFAVARVFQYKIFFTDEIGLRFSGFTTINIARHFRGDFNVKMDFDVRKISNFGHQNHLAGC